MRPMEKAQEKPKKMLPKNVYCGGIEASPAPAQKMTF